MFGRELVSGKLTARDVYLFGAAGCTCCADDPPTSLHVVLGEGVADAARATHNENSLVAGCHGRAEKKGSLPTSAIVVAVSFAKPGDCLKMRALQMRLQ